MDLRSAFEGGLTVEAFESLLSEDQANLHALHTCRAVIGLDDVQAVSSSRARFALIITEPWCGDSLAVVPVVFALFRAADVAVRVTQRDRHPELIDRYLTHGGRAIPIVLILDAEYAELLRWGARPAPAQRIVEESRDDVRAGRVDRTDIHRRVRAFYASDNGRTIVREIVEGLRP